MTKLTIISNNRLSNQQSASEPTLDLGVFRAAFSFAWNFGEGGSLGGFELIIFTYLVIFLIISLRCFYRAVGKKV